MGPEIMIILTGINPANTYIEGDDLIQKDKQIQVEDRSLPSSTKKGNINDSIQINNNRVGAIYGLFVY